jgi:hypothetical protein
MIILSKHERVTQLKFPIIVSEKKVEILLLRLGPIKTIEPKTKRIGLATNHQ